MNSMLRTRDFALVLVIIAFIVVAIVATAGRQSQSASSPAGVVKSMVPTGIASQDETTAVIYSPETPTREERQDSMRAKVADWLSQHSVTLPVPEKLLEDIDLETELAEADNTNESEEGALGMVARGVQNCVNKTTFTGLWNAKNIVITEAPSVRLVQEERAVFGSTSTILATMLQLPLRPAVQEDPVCLMSDVVGIAQDGSLIRNTEAPLYAIFGEETLIGYALDGVPIYGLANRSTNMCGAAFVGGELRYYLSAERDLVINCFSAKPVLL